MRTAVRSWDGWPGDPRRGDQRKSADTPPERTPDGGYVLYHGSSAEGAAAIISELRLRPDDLGVVGFGTTPQAVSVYGVIRGRRGPVLRVVVERAVFESQVVTREIGGSGRDQWLVNRPRTPERTSWDGVPLVLAERVAS